MRSAHKTPMCDSWAQSAVQPSGAGTEASPYLVNSSETLAWIAKQVNENGQTSIVVKQTSPIILTGNTWQPIGTRAYPFKGLYDGQGYPIIGLTIDQEKTPRLGFCGTIGNATTQNVYLCNVNIKGYEYLGGVAGYASGTSSKDVIIKGCYIDGSIYGQYDMAGILGYCGSYVELSNCIFKGIVNNIDANSPNLRYGLAIVDIAGDKSTVTIKDLYLETVNDTYWSMYSEGNLDTYVSNILLKRSSGKNFITGDFTGWIISASGTTLPSGFTWLEGQNGKTATLTDIQNWKNA